MDDIEQMKIQISKLEGFVTGLAESAHRLACDIDMLEKRVDKSRIRKHDNPVTAFLKKKAPVDWEAQEQKAIEMETNKAYSKMLPNCS